MRSPSTLFVGLLFPCLLHGQSPDSTTRPRAELTVAYTPTLLSNAAGGIVRGSLVQNAAVAQAMLDLRRLFGWHGAHFFVSLLGTGGQSPESFVGDIQGVLATTAPPGLRLEEAWLEQDMLRNHLSLLVGRYDINSEFYRLETSSAFLNPSFGIGPELSFAGVAGPSTYPFTSLGGRIAYKPTKNTVLRTAVLDGVPVDRPDGGIHPFARGDGSFAIAEFAILSRPDTGVVVHDRRFRIGRGPPAAPYAGKIAVGVWRFTTALPDLSDTTAAGNLVLHSRSGGAYLVADDALWHSSDTVTRLAVFVQLGLSDPSVTVVNGYVGGGLVVTGLVKSRRDDQLGLAVASAQLSSHFRRAQYAAGWPTSSPETAIELTYLASVTSWLGVHTDLQYVVRPGGNLSLGNALVPGLQLGLSYTF